MERAFSKDQILALYLNEIYLGRGSYGVAAAALNYFDKSLGQLELSEIAYLAALPKAPNNYHPVRNLRAATIRRNWVLDEMQQNGYITQNETDEAKAAPLRMIGQSGFDAAEAPYFTEEVRRQLISRFGETSLYDGGLSVRTTLDPYLQQIADNALERGLEALDRRQGWRGPLGVMPQGADIDEMLAAQTAKLRANHFAALVTKVGPRSAEIYVNGRNAIIPFELAFWAYPPRRDNGIRPPPLRDLRKALSKDDIVIVQPPGFTPDLIRNGFEPAPNYFALGQRPDVEGAIVALDPHTGRLLAMSGGYNYVESEFNRAVQALRQPGSAFKPFVYLAALDAGYSPTTRILDAPLVVDQGPGKPKWKPANYTKRFYGPSIMRVGIEKSRNLMTARLAMTIGMDRVQDYAKRFGLNDDLPPFLSMSLGAGETTLLRLTSAYGMLVNGGRKITPSLIDRIQDRHGKTIYRHDARDCGSCVAADGWSNQPIPTLLDTREQLTDPASAFQMVSMLEGVIKRGTGRSINALNLVVAGKTGTTNDNTNGWFIGFTPDLAIGVFIGYDRPRPLGKRETGSTVAVPIFGDFLMRLNWVSLGGGIHFTGEGYPLERLAARLKAFQARFGVQVFLEPGEAAITGAASLEVTVLDILNNGKDLAIIDSSVEAHMLDLLIYRQSARMQTSGPHPYMICGKSCLAGDIFGEFSFPQPLAVGDRLSIADAAGYTMVKKNWFNGVRMPAIVLKERDGSLTVARSFGYADFESSLG